MTRKILSWLSLQGYVDESNDKIVELGLQRIKSTFASILFSTVISWLFGDIIAGLIFELTYIPIRIYSGGYHAGSKKRCEYLSYGSILFCMLTIFYLPMKMLIMHLGMLFSGIIIFMLSPKESPNKPLNDTEKKVFRRKSIMYMIIAVCVYACMLSIDKVLYAKTVMYSVCLVACGLVLASGRLKIIKK